MSLITVEAQLDNVEWGIHVAIQSNRRGMAELLYKKALDLLSEVDLEVILRFSFTEARFLSWVGMADIAIAKLCESAQVAEADGLPDLAHGLRKTALTLRSAA